MYADQKILSFIQGRQVEGKRTLLIDLRLVEFPNGPSLLKCRRSTLREIIERQFVAISPGRDVWVTMQGVERMRERDNRIQKNYLIHPDAERELDTYVKELKRRYGF